MRKLIVKTVAITLSLMVGAFAIIYFIFSAFLPSSLASLYFRVNQENLSVKYSVKAYEKSGNVSDLATLTERVIVFGNDSLTVTYATMLINDDEYGQVLQSKSQGYNYYIVGSLVEALYASGSKTQAVEVAMQNTSTLSSGNPIEVILVCAFDASDIETANLIKEKLALNEPSVKINSYLTAINDFINN